MAALFRDYCGVTLVVALLFSFKIVGSEGDLGVVLCHVMNACSVVGTFKPYRTVNVKIVKNPSLVFHCTFTMF